MPLPVDVGVALADYLHAARLGSDCRNVVLRTRAPHHALTSTGVSQIVISAASQGRLATGRSSPTPAHGRNRDAPCRRSVDGDRAGSAPPQPGIDRNLRQGGPPGAQTTGAP